MVWTTTTASAAASVCWLRPQDAVTGLAGSAPAVLEQTLAHLATLAAAGCVVWLWVIASLAVAEAVDLRAADPGRRRSWAARLVLLTCGVALSGGVVVPAQAASGRATPRAEHVGVLEGLPLPERPSGRALAGPRRHHSGPVSPELVVVRPGDTLWALASDRLPDTAGPAAVDAWWRRVHAVNRAVIGPDPDLILPGQRLVVPAVDQ